MFFVLISFVNNIHIASFFDQYFCKQHSWRFFRWSSLLFRIFILYLSLISPMLTTFIMLLALISLLKTSILQLSLISTFVNKLHHVIFALSISFVKFFHTVSCFDQPFCSQLSSYFLCWSLLLTTFISRFSLISHFVNNLRHVFFCVDLLFC